MTAVHSIGMQSPAMIRSFAVLLPAHCRQVRPAVNRMDSADELTICNYSFAGVPLTDTGDHVN